MSQYFIADNGKALGPFDLEGIVAEINKRGADQSHVFRDGLAQWVKPAEISEIKDRLGKKTLPPPPILDEGPMDFEIGGHESQYLSVTLKPGRSLVAESGAMMAMEDGITMDTVTANGAHASQDLMDQALRMGKRYISGESLFLCLFENKGSHDAKVSFAAPFPGTILPVDPAKYGGELLCQKSSFLAASRTIELDIAFQKDLGAALFGGEGFILQRLAGKGQAFIHAGGSLIRKELKKGEKMRLDTGCLVALAPTVNYTVEMQQGVKNALFGGEGLFMAVLEGPGEILMQSLPFSRLARRMMVGAVGGQRGREEGSVLGPLGTLLRGDIRF